MIEVKDIHILFNVLMNVKCLTFISKLYRNMELSIRTNVHLLKYKIKMVTEK